MSNAKVLLVDDSQDTLDLVLMGVEAFGPPFSIETAKTASSAVDMINAGKYDAVILDIALPDITGAVLGELIRKKHPNLPIAFLTNYNGPQTIEIADEIGAHFWFKPDVLDNFEKLTNCIVSLTKNQPCDSSVDSRKVNPSIPNVEFPDIGVNNGN